MAMDTDYKRVSLRRRTATEWHDLNEKLLDGEIGVVTDSVPRKFKIGDGITTWRNLPFADKALTDRLDELAYGYGVASLETVPSEGVLIYNVAQIGTYANFSGIEVLQDDLDSGLVQFRFTDGSWQKVVVPNKIVFPIFYIDEEMNLRSTPFDSTKINFSINQRGELILQL